MPIILKNKRAMVEEYFELKQEIRRKMYESVQLSSFEKAETLYYNIAKISEEDGLEIAFDIIYKESKENAAYIEEAFLENVYERFHMNGNQANINSLKKRIEKNKEKPAANILYKQILNMRNVPD